MHWHGSTLSLGRQSLSLQHWVWLAEQTPKTDTAKKANLVFAKVTEAAGPSGGETFVDVVAGVIGIDIESRGTNAVADLTSDGDTLSPVGAVALLLAGCQDNLPAIPDVGRLAAAVGSVTGDAQMGSRCRPQEGISLSLHSLISRHMTLISCWKVYWMTHFPWEQSSRAGQGLGAEHWLLSVLPMQATFGLPDDPEGHLQLKLPGVFSRKAPMLQGWPGTSSCQYNPSCLHRTAGCLGDTCT
jgi:hypothetical protein